MELRKKLSYDLTHNLTHDFSFYCTQKSFLVPVVHE